MDLNDEMKTMMMNIENHTNHINQKNHSSDYFNFKNIMSESRMKRMNGLHRCNEIEYTFTSWI